MNIVHVRQTRITLTCNLLWRGNDSLFASSPKKQISVKVPPDIPLAAYPGLIQMHLTFPAFSLESLSSSTGCISAGKDRTCETIERILLLSQESYYIDENAKIELGIERHNCVMYLVYLDNYAYDQ